MTAPRRQDLNLPQVVGIVRGDSDERPKYSHPPLFLLANFRVATPAILAVGAI